MRLIDLTGQKFGRLTVLEKFKKEGRDKYSWRCLCDCGNETSPMGRELRNGDTQSCGCFHKDAMAAKLLTHGHSANGSWSPEYRAWTALKWRCHPKNTRKYRGYYSRGIRVCPEWQKDFLTFFNHIGPRPSPRHSIDRINNDGNYEPGNVRWATRKQQQANRRCKVKS